jgi:ADP-heptose:LPS heptosyltransferase
LHALPTNPGKIILVNPTKYLGNLLIAGGLIQQFSAHCQARGIELRIVLDDSFRELLAGSLPDRQVIWYPRRAIARAGIPGKFRLYLQCMKQIRQFRADIAFNIEEDSVSHRLTQLSGAAYILGCSTTRHHRGYHHVVPVNFRLRPAAHKHRWYSFAEVFAFVGLEANRVGYLQLQNRPLDEPAAGKLAGAGLREGLPVAVIHAGATKAYKRWPSASFAALAGLLMEQGMQVVFIGAGDDCRITDEIIAGLPPEQGYRAVNACGLLSLAELASFLAGTDIMIGNDSGPFHLASALGIPGVVIFGPTDADIWKPLGDKIRLLQHRDLCSPDCTRKNCLFDHRCLRMITPAETAAAVENLLSAGPGPDVQ